MCIANPLWGAPRIHGELLKLGIEINLPPADVFFGRGQTILTRRQSIKLNVSVPCTDAVNAMLS